MLKNIFLSPPIGGDGDIALSHSAAILSSRTTTRYFLLPLPQSLCVSSAEKRDYEASGFCCQGFFATSGKFLFQLTAKNPGKLPRNINRVTRYYELVYNKKQAFISLFVAPDPYRQIRTTVAHLPPEPGRSRLTLTASLPTSKCPEGHPQRLDLAKEFATSAVPFWRCPALCVKQERSKL